MSFAILRISCPDQPGLVRAVTATLARMGGNIVRNDEFVDRINRHFFMRTAFEHIAPDKYARLEEAVRAAMPSHAAVALSAPRPKKIAVLATKEYHCLGDLLLRHHFGELDAEITAVISNHDFLHDLVARFGLPYHALPHEHLSRGQHEEELMRCLSQYDVDYIILAKYMRILSPAIVARYPGRMINIHHSFLPAFIGAKPYHQAYARGVKMIGATAHFVTNDLDEGPIIAQHVVSVDHNDDPATMARAGREVGTQTLAKALKLVFNDRVFVTGNRTVVF